MVDLLFAATVIAVTLCADSGTPMATPKWAGADDIRSLCQAAERGDAQAQHDLATCYGIGYGVLQDFKKAAEWYQKSAQQGLPAAQNALGSLYINRAGVPEDKEQAFVWYRRAAEQGLPEAQDAVGGCYLKGVGVPQDSEQAVAWYRKAADQGYAWAQYNLGVRYAKGDGVSVNYQEAVEWWLLAAEQGQGLAEYNLAMSYANGEGVAQDYTRAVKWWRLAAEHEEEEVSIDSRYNLGVLLYYRKGVPQDYDQAVKWWLLAAEAGDTEAQAKLEETSRRGVLRPVIIVIVTGLILCFVIANAIDLFIYFLATRRVVRNFNHMSFCDREPDFEGLDFSQEESFVLNIVRPATSTAIIISAGAYTIAVLNLSPMGELMSFCYFTLLASKACLSGRVFSLRAAGLSMLATVVVISWVYFLWKWWAKGDSGAGFSVLFDLVCLITVWIAWRTLKFFFVERREIS